MNNTITALLVTMVALGALGCATHEPEYVTIHMPEKHADEANGLAQSISTEGQMNAIQPMARIPRETNSAAAHLTNPTDQTNPGRTGEHLYTEAPKDQLSPVSSRSANRIYSESATNDLAANEEARCYQQDQGSTASDVALVRRIRRELNRDYELSIIAADIKIVAKNGIVTLEGKVKTDGERKKLETLVQKTAGVISATNQVAVRHDQ
jgi:hypothetical protein